MLRSYFNSHLPYYLNSVIVLSLILSFDHHRNLHLALWVIYAFLPILDIIIPNDNINPTPQESKILAKQWKWKIPVYLFVFVEWYALFFSLRISTSYPQSTYELFIHIISIGHTNAIGFLFAHELIHKASTFDRALGTLDMVKNLYMHFYLEHIYGHHKYVCTPSDPATAKLNQTLYSFLCQTLFGSFQNSWNREIKKLQKRGKSVFSIHNRMLLFLLLEFSFTLFIWKVYGSLGLVVFASEAAFGIFILETINYVRHYGLVRKEISPGEYEQVNIKHSWNAPQRVQNMVFLKLQRHSDHHANSYKPYQCLLSLDESPTLPAGYLGCTIPAMLPPVWRKMINPVAVEFNKGRNPTSQIYKYSRQVYYCWLTIQVTFFSVLAFS